MYMCDPPRIYPSLPEYTPLSKTICDPPRIHPSLPEYTPIFNNYYATLPESIPPSQNIPSLQQLYATLPETTLPSENTPLYFDNYMPPSLSEYIPRPLSTIFLESTPQSLDMPLFLETTCIREIIYHSLPELKNILGVRGRFWEGRKIL